MADLNTLSFASDLIELTLLDPVGTPGAPSVAGDHQVGAVADKLAGFIAAAHTSLDMAVYDFRLAGAAADRIVAALHERAQAGVVVRVIHDPTTAPAAPVPGGDLSIATVGGLGKPDGGAAFLDRIAADAQVKAVSGFQALMHNKYILRDALSDDAAVLTGSANYTTDAWNLQENNLVLLRSQPLSTFYQTDFLQLWTRGKITRSTGTHDTGTVMVGGVAVTVAFTPGESATVVDGIVGVIERAQRRVTIAAMVMSSGPILAAVSEAIDRGLAITGLYDGPQMDTVLHQWAAAGIGTDKAAAWAKVARHLARKNSTPYGPERPHDFMHAKLIVADDVAVTGSFNFSNHARGNAENALFLADASIAACYDETIKRWAARYARDA